VLDGWDRPEIEVEWVNATRVVPVHAVKTE
jgi:hypothetical protein